MSDQKNQLKSIEKILTRCGVTQDDIIVFIKSAKSFLQGLGESPPNLHGLALSLAAIYGRYTVCEALLNHEKADVNSPDNNKRTPLWWAASKGQCEIVKLLLTHGAKVDRSCSSCQLTALHVAANNRHRAMVKLLLDELAPVDPQDAKGETPLSKAAANNDLEIVKLLISKKASTSAARIGGKTLQQVANTGVFDLEVKALLIGKGSADDYEDDRNPYLGHLCRHITKRNLENFFNSGSDIKESVLPYAEQAMELVKKLRADGSKWAADLALLSLYDIAILVDDSRSMVTQEKGCRKQIIESFVFHITDMYSHACDDGEGKVLRLQFLNTGNGGNNLDTASIKRAFRSHIYSGTSEFGTKLKKKILEDLVNKEMKKPLLVVVTADGDVYEEGKTKLAEVIKDCIGRATTFRGGEHSVSFQFIRVGNDNSAEAMFARLRGDPKLSAHIDCQSADIDLGAITTGCSTQGYERIARLLLGAISKDVNQPVS